MSPEFSNSPGSFDGQLPQAPAEGAPDSRSFQPSPAFRLSPHHNPQIAAHQAQLTLQRAVELTAENDYRAAIQNAERALVAAREAFSSTAPSKLAKFCFALAGLSLVFGDSARAEGLLRETLPLKDGLSRQDKKEAFGVLALGISDWSVQEFNPGAPGLGAKLLEVKIGLGVELFGLGDRRVRNDVQSLGIMHFHSGRYLAAKECFERLLFSLSEDLSKNERVEVEYNFSACLIELDQKSEAKKRLEALVEKTAEWMPLLSDDVKEIAADSRVSLAKLWIDQGNLDQAERILEEGVKELDKSYGAGSEKHLSTYGAMIQLQLLRGNFGDAFDMLNLQFELLELSQNDDLVELVSAQMKCGEIMELVGERITVRLKADELEGPELGNFAALSENLISDLEDELLHKLNFHPENFAEMFELLRSAAKEGKDRFVERLDALAAGFFTRAEQLYLSSEQTATSHSGPQSPQLILIYESLAGISHLLGDKAKSMAYQKKANQISAEVMAANF